MHSVHHNDLKILLKTTQPASLLLSDPNPLPGDVLAACPNCQVTRVEGDILAQLDTLGRFDLGIIANSLEHVDRKTAGRILARLRDVHTRRLVVLVPIAQVHSSSLQAIEYKKINILWLYIAEFGMIFNF